MDAFHTRRKGIDNWPRIRRIFRSSGRERNWWTKVEKNTTRKFRFTSYERGGESSNDYAMFRYHVNCLGRFSSPDPIAGSLADPQSLNRYTYVLDDPANLVDPLGLDGVACWINGEFGFCVTVTGQLYDIGIGRATHAPLLDGGEGGGGGGAGGHSFSACSNNLVNQTSLQTTFHAGDSFLASALLGNNVQSVVQGFQKLFKGNFLRAGRDFASAGASSLAGPAASLVPSPAAIESVTVTTLSVSTSASEVAVSATQTTASVVTSYTPLGELAQGAAGILDVLFVPKLTYDATAYALSAVACKLQTNDRH